MQGHTEEIKEDINQQNIVIQRNIRSIWDLQKEMKKHKLLQDVANENLNKNASFLKREIEDKLDLIDKHFNSSNERMEKTIV